MAVTYGIEDEIEAEQKQQQEQTTKTKKTTSNPACSVQFDLSKTTIHDIYTRSELTTKDYEALWLLQKDYHHINSWMRLTIKMMRQGLPEEEDYCYRGLEHRMDMKQDRRQYNITSSVYAVLNEQSRQRKNKISDNSAETMADMLAEVYKGYSVACQLDGYTMGKLDAQAVRSNPKKNREQQKRRTSGSFEAEDVINNDELDDTIHEEREERERKRQERRKERKEQRRKQLKIEKALKLVEQKKQQEALGKQALRSPRYNRSSLRDLFTNSSSNSPASTYPPMSVSRNYSPKPNKNRKKMKQQQLKTTEKSSNYDGNNNNELPIKKKKASRRGSNSSLTMVFKKITKTASSMARSKSERRLSY